MLLVIGKRTRVYLANGTRSKHHRTPIFKHFFLRSLFPLATIVTPNLPEASALLGGRPIQDVAAMEAAARDLHALGPQYVLVKGGHLDTGARLRRPPL